MKTYDVIVPFFDIKEDVYLYIKNWFKELPIRKLILGFGKDKIEIPKKYENQIVVIDQRKNKTLGKCITELMSKVKTKWFVYLHSDVMITEHAFSIMKKYMKDGIGGIEGEPIIIRHVRGELKHIFLERWFIKRGYSGFQVFRTECLQDLIDKMEDDYVFTNEDLITQDAVTSSGYKYIKTWAMYFHYNEGLRKNTEKNAKDMFLGLLKYTNPNELTKDLMRVIMKSYNDTYKLIDLDEIIEFVNKNNIEWLNYIEKIINKTYFF